MKRRTIDALLISFGLTLTVLLLARLGLLHLWRTSPDSELFTPPRADAPEPSLSLSNLARGMNRKPAFALGIRLRHG